MYVDALSIRPQGQYMKAWNKWVTTDPVTSASYPQFKYKVTKTLTYFDCRAETSADKQMLAYEEDNSSGPVQSLSFTDAQLQFQDPVPGSLGQSLLHRVCANKR